MLLSTEGRKIGLFKQTDELGKTKVRVEVTHHVPRNSQFVPNVVRLVRAALEQLRRIAVDVSNACQYLERLQMIGVNRILGHVLLLRF